MHNVQHNQRARTLLTHQELLPCPEPKGNHYSKIFHHKSILSVFEIYINGIIQYIFHTVLFTQRYFSGNLSSLLQ